MTIRSADFPKRWNIGANDPAVVKHCLDDGQPEAFDERRRQQQFAMLITPFELGVRNPSKEHNVTLQVELLDSVMNVCRLRSFDPDHNHQGCWINHLFQQQAPKDPQCKNNVLVPAMLGNAEQKRLTKPCRYGTGCSDGRPRIDAVVNGDRFPAGEPGRIKGEPPESGV